MCPISSPSVRWCRSRPAKPISIMPASGCAIRSTAGTISMSSCVFQGASYFRAIGKGQLYGLSARGLAIDTGQPKGEEFPFFRSLLDRRPPDDGTRRCVVHALLNSPSATGAYRFNIKPGEVDADGRRDDRCSRAAISSMPASRRSPACICSMNSRQGRFRRLSPGRARFRRSDDVDWRRRMDLAAARQPQDAAGERLHRPQSPSGFGLMQRKRHYRRFPRSRSEI